MQMKKVVVMSGCRDHVQFLQRCTVTRESESGEMPWEQGWSAGMQTETTANRGIPDVSVSSCRGTPSPTEANMPPPVSLIMGIWIQGPSANKPANIMPPNISLLLASSSESLASLEQVIGGLKSIINKNDRVISPAT